MPTSARSMQADIAVIWVPSPDGSPSPYAAAPNELLVNDTIQIKLEPVAMQVTAYVQAPVQALLLVCAPCYGGMSSDVSVLDEHGGDDQRSGSALHPAAGSAAGPADRWQLRQRLAAGGKALRQLCSLRHAGGGSGSGQFRVLCQLRVAAAVAAPCCQPAPLSTSTTAPTPCDIDHLWTLA